MRQFFNPFHSESPAPNKSEGKLLNKVAVITGGDSGIGRAVAYAFAKEGADIVISLGSEIRRRAFRYFHFVQSSLVYPFDYPRLQYESQSAHVSRDFSEEQTLILHTLQYPKTKSDLHPRQMMSSALMAVFSKSL